MDFEPRDWRFPLIDYTLHDILPDDPKEAASIRRRSLHFYYDPIVKTLYRRSYDGILLRCLSNSEAQEVLKEAHDDIYEAHQPGPTQGPITQAWILLADHDSRCHPICTKV